MSGSAWRRRVLVLALAAVTQAATMAQAVPDSLIEGVWQTAEKSELTIAPCPQGYCGYITKIVVPDHIIAQYGDDLAAIGTNYTDYNNKNPALRDRPIQGLQILTLRPGSDPWYYEGEIYNPEDGNVYAGSVEVTGADRLKLKGCVLYVLCQEQIWLRVSSN